jgi:V/A-type H+/Na+-transporting ATPase subunit E
MDGSTMKSIDDNIETLSRAILNEAESEAERVKAEAREKADEIRKRGQAEAEAEKKRILDRAKQDVDRVRSQAIANARLKARSAQFQRREALLDKVFASANGQVSGIQAWSNYDEIAIRLLKEAIQQVNADKLVVHLDSKTAQRLNQHVLKEVAVELKVELVQGDPLAKGTGVVVESENGRLQFDNTLENRLSRLQNILRSPVYHLLSGEKL